VDKKYIFHEQVRDIAVWLIGRSDPLYVYGPPSVGKTSVIKQLAARRKSFSRERRCVFFTDAFRITGTMCRFGEKIVGNG
jgi:Cdc6-like AAA superfamily ATPase